MTSNVAVGLHGFDDNQSLDQCISEANGSGYGFIVAPITKPSFRRVLNLDCQMSQEQHEKWKNQPFFDVDDLAIRSATWSSKVIGLLSNWIHLDSVHEDIRLCSEIVTMNNL
jgi:protein arginine N-methyltransferase 5